ncbi:uncharacterized protein [Periplaneta americana]|uniref:uncharacterized protein n=1 Tax=Periplaneta americana TaxID=6978 RepID=UPI0037E8A3EE
MLLRNLDPPQLCNGTLLSVKKLMPNVIEATVLTGKAKGKDVFIPRIPLIPTDLPFTFKRLQFPVRLAFAMTINKAQGQSLKFAGINLENSCFSHVQIPSELNQEEVLHPMMPIARMRLASQSQTVTSLNSSLHYLHHFACTLEESDIRLPHNKSHIDDYLVTLVSGCIHLKKVRFQGRLGDVQTLVTLCNPVFVQQSRLEKVYLDVIEETPSKLRRLSTIYLIYTEAVKSEKPLVELKVTPHYHQE